MRRRRRRRTGSDAHSKKPSSNAKSMRRPPASLTVAAATRRSSPTPRSRTTCLAALARQPPQPLPSARARVRAVSTRGRPAAAADLSRISCSTTNASLPVTARCIGLDDAAPTVAVAAAAMSPPLVSCACDTASRALGARPRRGGAAARDTAAVYRVFSGGDGGSSAPRTGRGTGPPGRARSRPRGGPAGWPGPICSSSCTAAATRPR